jgi:hypothetical protein
MAAKRKNLEAEIRSLAADIRARALRDGERWYLGHGSGGSLSAEEAYVRLQQEWIWRRFKVFVPPERLRANLIAAVAKPG